MEEKKKKKGSHAYRRGILTGVLASALVVVLALTGLRLTGHMVLVSPESSTQETVEAKGSDEGATSSAAEGTTSVTTGSAVNTHSLAKLKELEGVIDEYYYHSDTLSQEQKENGLYKGLMESLEDPYSVYYTAEELEDLQQETSGTFGGIGVLMQQDTESGLTKVIKVYSDTPASRGGMKKGDIFYRIDGKDATTMTSDEIVKNVRGELGTDVELVMYRDGEQVKMTLTRETISTPTVSSKLLDNSIGYLQITQFDTVTKKQFNTHFKKLQDKGMKAMILDLRDNPGGSVDTVTAIAKKLLPKGKIFFMRDKNGKEEVYRCSGADFDLPLVVLVNGNSASASEILSGAIQDAKIGTLVGTQTYGKGVVQSILNLGDGSGVKITIANYFTRNGRDINKVGIKPDVELKFDADAYQKDGTDNQLERAKEILNKKLGAE